MAENSSVQNVGNHGPILVSASNSHTLCTFNRNSPSVSRLTGALGTITRGDGPLQVTDRGLPLYFFHMDASV